MGAIDSDGESIDEIVGALIRGGLSGDSVDAIVCTYSPQLTDQATKIEISLSSIESLYAMAKPIKQIHVVKETDSSFVAFAIYRHSDACPVSRLYYSRLSLTAIANAIIFLESVGIKVNTLTSWNQLDFLAETIEAEQRVSTWKKDHRTKRVDLVENLANGRHRNTFVDRTTYLNSDNCLICKSAATRLMTSSIGSTDNGDGTALMFWLCDNHAEEAMADDKMILGFLAKYCGLNLPWRIKPINPKTDYEYFNDAICMVKNVLGCTLDKEPNQKTREITGVRPSGFKIIVRIQSKAKHGYAYMVLDPNGNNVERIDDAQDHPDLNIQWDHRHTGLPKNNKPAEPSYTLGYASADAKAILALVENAEKVYGLR